MQEEGYLQKALFLGPEVSRWVIKGEFCPRGWWKGRVNPHIPGFYPKAGTLGFIHFLPKRAKLTKTSRKSRN